MKDHGQGQILPGHWSLEIEQYLWEMHLILVIHETKFVSFLLMLYTWLSLQELMHDDVIKWKHFPHYWPFVQGIHWSPVNSPHKDQWCRALMFSLIWAWINGWVNNREAGDLRRHCAHYDVIVIVLTIKLSVPPGLPIQGSLWGPCID